MTTVAEQKIGEAISLRAQLDVVKAELRALKPKRPARAKTIPAGYLREVSVVITTVPIGPRMKNGLFITRRCPTCGHRT